MQTSSIQPSLLLHKYGPGTQLLYAPIYLLSGEPALSFNIFAMLSCIASALTAYFVAWKWFDKRYPIAIVAGVCYGFAPFAFLELPRPFYFAGCWSGR